ncbi:MAG: hypothetical protein HWN68_04335 [Desulfobacterales bacterium]|nr:hypothetical protein [Desulfobacterales bacterium]
MAIIGDIVLVYQEEQPAFFACIEDISADPKPDWYQVKLLILRVPVAEAVWVLREEYVNGETFTMDGRRIRIEKVRGPNEPEGQPSPADRGPKKKDDSSDSKVISLFPRKRR